MNCEIVEIDKRVRVAGLCLLPGAKLEFQNIGQANSFIYRNGGKHVTKKPKRNKANSDPDSRANSKASKSGTSEADVAPVAE